MGSIASVYCKCGFKQEDILLGGGMLNHTTVCYFPHYCDKCNILSKGNLYKNEYCPECGNSDVISYDDKRAFKRKGKRTIFSCNESYTLGKHLFSLTVNTYVQFVKNIVYVSISLDSGIK